MISIFSIAILIACAASITVAYLVAADFWRHRSVSSQDRIISITRDAHETAGRLMTLYQKALKDMRRH
ncbi:hypothetical protein [Arthrobacter bambusae]|uniref:hypothetical protein n=1 Tax=Arthrobacter bambusae TaxID=1338426 RepID=UPI0027813FA3|nr:hypothetical protein [Arthrobacter bambusae]MDQ0212886.1 hypothetical protein [Arthrobacter bambusae]MDQ0237192.1 hypothetical protein [Arthrobacter bambusae]